MFSFYKLLIFFFLPAKKNIYFNKDGSVPPSVDIFGGYPGVNQCFVGQERSQSIQIVLKKGIMLCKRFQVQTLFHVKNNCFMANSI